MCYSDCTGGCRISGWKSSDGLQVFLGHDSSHPREDVSIQSEELYHFSLTKLQRCIPLSSQGRATRVVQSPVVVRKKRSHTHTHTHKQRHVVSHRPWIETNLVILDDGTQPCKKLVTTVGTKRPRWHIPRPSYGYMGKFSMLNGTFFKGIRVFIQRSCRKRCYKGRIWAFPFSLISLRN